MNTHTDDGEIKCIVFYIKKLVDVRLFIEIEKIFKCKIYFIIDHAVDANFIKQMVKYSEIKSSLQSLFSSKNDKDISTKINAEYNSQFTDILYNFLEKEDLKTQNYFIVNPSMVKHNEMYFLNTTFDYTSLNYFEVTNNRYIGINGIVNSISYVQDLFVQIVSGKNITIKPLQKLIVDYTYDRFDKVYHGLTMLGCNLGKLDILPIKELRLRTGNFFLFDNKLVIGKDILLYHDSEQKKILLYNEEKMVLYLKDYFNVQEVLLIGSKCHVSFPSVFTYRDQYTFQPFYHLDLFFTVIGKITSAKYCFIVGELCESFNYSDMSTNEPNSELAWIRETLDNTEKQLLKLYPDAKIIRLPIALDKYFLLSYINMQVENINNGAVINLYLPLYKDFKFYKVKNMKKKHFRHLQNVVKNILEANGFNVHFLQYNFSPLQAYEQGSLHCISKVLYCPSI